jgi:hypothetical protein
MSSDRGRRDRQWLLTWIGEDSLVYFDRKLPPDLGEYLSGLGGQQPARRSRPRGRPPDLMSPPDPGGLSQVAPPCPTASHPAHVAYPPPRPPPGSAALDFPGAASGEGAHPGDGPPGDWRRNFPVPLIPRIPDGASDADVDMDDDVCDWWDLESFTDYGLTKIGYYSDLL